MSDARERGSARTRAQTKAKVGTKCKKQRIQVRGVPVFIDSFLLKMPGAIRQMDPLLNNPIVNTAIRHKADDIYEYALNVTFS